MILFGDEQTSKDFGKIYTDFRLLDLLNDDAFFPNSDGRF